MSVTVTVPATFEQTVNPSVEHDDATHVFVNGDAQLEVQKGDDELVAVYARGAWLSAAVKTDPTTQEA